MSKLVSAGCAADQARAACLAAADRATRWWRWPNRWLDLHQLVRTEHAAAVRAQTRWLELVRQSGPGRR